MQIERIAISKIKPYEKNAKRHTDEQIQHIINSIEQFGMNDPIGIWGEKNVIVEGHGRYFALKKMGVKEVDCIRLDHLSDEERKAYTLVHNQATLETPFDDDLLKIELDGIFDIDMSDFGFDSDFDEKEEIKKEEGEVPFTEELLLTHNYIVLYFDNDFDWEVAQDKFGLKQVKDLIPRKGQPKGIGRVINGKKVLAWQS